MNTLYYVRFGDQWETYILLMTGNSPSEAVRSCRAYVPNDAVLEETTPICSTNDIFTTPFVSL